MFQGERSKVLTKPECELHSTVRSMSDIPGMMTPAWTMSAGRQLDPDLRNARTALQPHSRPSLAADLHVDQPRVPHGHLLASHRCSRARDRMFAGEHTVTEDCAWAHHVASATDSVDARMRLPIEAAHERQSGLFPEVTVY